MAQGATTSGRQEVPGLAEVDPERVRRMLAKRRQERGELISVLQDIQAGYGYLPREALRIVADETGRSLVDVYGIATFYRTFTLEPRGKHLIWACQGTACHVRGSGRVVEEFEHQLGIRAGETTPDREFTLETVNCLGACALGPVVVIDGRYFSKVRRPRVRQLLDEAREGLGRADAGADRQRFPIEVSCPRCNHSLMDEDFPIDGRPSIRCTVSFGGRPGWLRLSSVYGSPGMSAEHEIPPETVVDFFCPHCHGQLADRSACPACEAPMVPMLIRGGGIVRMCSRRGCQSRALDLF